MAQAFPSDVSNADTSYDTFFGENTVRTPRYDQISPEIQSRLNAIRQDHLNGRSEMDDFTGFDNTDQPSRRALSVIAPHSGNAHRQVNVSDSRNDPDWTGGTIPMLPTGNQNKPNFAQIPPNSIFGVKPSLTSTMRSQMPVKPEIIPNQGVRPKSAPPTTFLADIRNLRQGNSGTPRFQMPVRPRVPDPNSQNPVRPSAESVNFNLNNPNLNRMSGNHCDMTRNGISSGQNNGGNPNFGIVDQFRLHHLQKNAYRSNRGQPETNINIGNQTPVHIDPIEKNSTPIVNPRKINQTHATVNPNGGNPNFIPDDTSGRNSVHDLNGRHPASVSVNPNAGGTDVNGAYDNSRGGDPVNHQRRIETEVKAKLHRLQRTVTNLQSVADDTRVVLEYQNKDYTLLCALSTQLKGNLDLVKSLRDSILPYNTFCSNINITDMLFEVSLRIPEWEGYVSKTLANIRILEKEQIPQQSQVYQNGSTHKPVKVTTSEFPKFDGYTDFDNWSTKWWNLAAASKLDEHNLGIKMRESIVEQAEELVGTNLMSVGVLNDLWVKLKEIYDRPIVRMQKATREFINIKLQGNSVMDAYKVLTAGSDAMFKANKVNLTLETLMTN